MKYTLYMDESGEHGLSNINPNFPVFVLCGVLIPEVNYQSIRKSINDLKESIWGDKKVIFHSRDIRKCEKEFSVLFDLDVKKHFFTSLNTIMSESSYTVMASAIDKEKYVKKYGKLSDDVYEIALSFIIERSVFWLDDQNDTGKQLEIIIEKRGKKEDKRLEEHFQRLLSRGTGYVAHSRLKAYDMTIDFCDKKENINGLQLADLVAYPIARYVMEPNRANPAFDVVRPKIYAKNGKLYGLKVYP